jgi:hypothetical protein
MKKQLLSSMLLLTMMVFGATNVWGETFTATFKTNAWDQVYAYAWTSVDGEATLLFLGEWPGTQLEASNGVYTVTIEADAAPAFIIFNNGNGGAGNQTADLAFENEKAYEYIVLPTEIVNPGFNPEADPIGWEAVLSGEYRDIGMYQIGGEQMVRFAAPTADETHLSSEFAAGFECRWSTNFAAYTQQIALPAGAYALSYDVENVNGSTTKAAYENRFFVQVGETQYLDESTEWMEANSSWTTHTIKFILTEETPITISLGYGTGSNNIGANNTPALYVSHLVMGTFDPEADSQAELQNALAELQDAITAAKALKVDYRTVGLDDFNAAIATAEGALEATELEAVNAAKADLAAAVAAFKKANYYIDFEAGEYYIIDAMSGMFIAAGHNWGTRGIVNEMGLDLILTPYTESRTVTIDSRVSNGGNSHFLGENLFMDSSEWGFGLEYVGFGFYIAEPNSGKYISVDYNDNLVLSDTPHEWIIVTKEGVIAERLDEMAEATATNPVDATFLIKANNFNRNDPRNAEAWEVSADCTNKNLSGGNNVNNCAESYHSTFTIMQTISGAPAGVYELTAQGFYRQDDQEEEAAPQFFANGVNGDVPVQTGTENNMSAASESFSAGLYTIEPIRFTVKEDGMLYVGIYTSGTHQWVIFDNFRLTYFGEEIVDAISEVNAKAQNNAIYNLNGQQVMKAQKGIFIQNGKKVILK